MRYVTSCSQIVSMLDDASWKPNIEEIGWCMAQMRPFGSHGLPYTYAQHSILVSKLVPKHLALSGLLHDAHLTYVGVLSDAQREAVNHFTNGRWVEWEAKFHNRVMDHFAIPRGLNKEVQEANQLATEFEMGHLFNHSSRIQWNKLGFKTRTNAPPKGFKFEQWDAGKAYHEFMNRVIGVGAL